VDDSGYDGAPFIAEFYDFVVPYTTRQDVSFYVETACEYGGPVLELGCGTGRVLIPTARAGVDITELDAAERMLAACRERLRAEPPEVRQRARVSRGDMRAFDLGRTFQVVTIPFRPFQHLLTVEEQLACLAAIRRHLAPNGRLVFDPPFILPDGRIVVRRQRMLDRDLINQINTSELVYYVTHPDGRQERLLHLIRMRCLFRFEAEHLLARAGFAVEHLYAGFDRSPYGSQYPGELIFVARPSG
jgi:SAM-dependent methyltransferase